MQRGLRAGPTASGARARCLRRRGRTNGGPGRHASGDTNMRMHRHVAHKQFSSNSTVGPIDMWSDGMEKFWSMASVVRHRIMV